jgi:hypothetical protein
VCRIAIDAINMQLDEISPAGRSSLRAEQRTAGAVPALAPLFSFRDKIPSARFLAQGPGLKTTPGKFKARGPITRAPPDLPRGLGRSSGGNDVQESDCRLPRWKLKLHANVIFPRYRARRERTRHPRLPRDALCWEQFVGNAGNVTGPVGRR